MKVFDNATQPNDERVVVLTATEYNVLALGLRYLNEGGAFVYQENRDDARRMAETLNRGRLND